MLSVACAAFSVASVAFASQAGRRWLAIASAALGAGAAIVALGLAPGLVVALASWMTAASALVLVLSPRPRLASPVALCGSFVGIVACAGSGLGWPS